MNNILKNNRKIFNTSDGYILAKVSALENNEYKVTYYEIVSATSGTITPPTGATFNDNEFGESGNAILSSLTASNKPNFETPLTSGGVPVTVSLNTGTGAWVTSGSYVDTSVAILYSIKIKAVDWSNLIYANIVDFEESSSTGTGGLVRQTSPTLTTPNIGVATATRIITTEWRADSGGSTRVDFSAATSAPAFKLTNLNKSSLTASTERIQFDIVNANVNTLTWATGNITTQRYAVFGSPTYAFDSSSTITNAYTLYVNAPTAGTNATITNNYAIGANTRCLFGNAIVGTWATSSLYAVFRHSSVVDASQYALVQNSGGYTYLNSSVQTNICVASTALLILTANLITVKDSANFAFNTSTGTKLGTATTQKIGFWAATPIVQPTTAVTAATYAAVGGSTVQTSDTFDGYTVGQVVKALRNAGLLA